MSSDVSKTKSQELREQALRRGESASSLRFYKVATSLWRQSVNRWISLKTANTEVLDLPGPTILAPVHRSHIDVALIATSSSRRIRALGKESLFKVPVVSYICAALGAIPIRRGKADRDAMKAAKSLLDAGESMIVFPEGSRGSGAQIEELFDGTAWLAAKTGARIVPIGIAGTEEAFPPGAKYIKRAKTAMVVGDPLEPPLPEKGKRVSREQLSTFTQDLAKALQKAQDSAYELQEFG